MIWPWKPRMRLKKSTIAAIKNDMTTSGSLSVNTMVAINEDPHFQRLNLTHKGVNGALVDWGAGLNTLLQSVAGARYKATGISFDWGKLLLRLLPLLLDLLPLIFAFL